MILRNWIWVRSAKHILQVVYSILFNLIRPGPTAAAPGLGPAIANNNGIINGPAPRSTAASPASAPAIDNNNKIINGPVIARSPATKQSTPRVTARAGLLRPCGPRSDGGGERKTRTVSRRNPELPGWRTSAAHKKGLGQARDRGTLPEFPFPNCADLMIRVNLKIQAGSAAHGRCVRENPTCYAQLEPFRFSRAARQESFT